MMRASPLPHDHPAWAEQQALVMAMLQALLAWPACATRAPLA
jgi:hypothetical protein